MSITDRARHNREYVRRRLAANSPEFAAVLEWIVWELAHASDTEAERAVIERCWRPSRPPRPTRISATSGLANIVDKLAGKLTAHPAHEESDGAAPDRRPVDL